MPAVILIGGSGPTDRDETVAGIPVFGQLAARSRRKPASSSCATTSAASARAAAAAESVTIADYAEDARRCWCGSRSARTSNKDRIGLVGHSEGALVAMLLAGRERGKVGAMALLAGPSTSGTTIVLEQQKHLLSKMQIDDAQRAEKVALQEKINAAVINGTRLGRHCPKRHARSPTRRGSTAS